MVGERTESRELDLHKLLPWTELFRGFSVAIDPKKLVLAAGGILATALAWQLLALFFYNLYDKPKWRDHPYQSASVSGKDEAEKNENAWRKFKRHRAQWRVLHEAAGAEERKYDAGDLADTIAEYEELQAIEEKLDTRDERVIAALRERLLARDDKPLTKAEKIQFLAMGSAPLPVGKLRTWPWFEDRGPNPYLLVTAQAGTPWTAGGFFDWLIKKQIPVLIEPLVKFLLPVIYLLRTNDLGLLNTLYFLLVLLATIAIWSLFGGAITRMVVVEVARREKLGITEAFLYAWRRWLSYLTAPLFPLGIAAGLVVLLILFFGIPQLVPVLGDFWSGLLWPLPLGAGLVIAVLLVGLIGWPMMASAISAEGPEGSWEAVSRTYSYVYQAPWHFLWYSLVALAYGVAVVFFVGFMGSFMVYLAKWGVSQTPFLGPNYINREPSYLFVYAPTSFGWRTLLLEGGTVDGQLLVEHGAVNQDAYNKLLASMYWWNKVGAFLASVSIYLVFLLILGFGYSYFWTAGTIMYLLLRNKVDDAEFDEVYFEEEDQEPIYRESPVPQPPPASAPSPLQIGTAALRPAPPPPSPPPVTAGAGPPVEPAKPAPAPTAPPASEPPRSGGDGADKERIKEEG